MCYRSYGLFAVLAGAFAFAFMLVGFAEIALGIVKNAILIVQKWAHVFISIPPQPNEGDHSSPSPVLEVLHGIELLLLAPLPFLIVSSMAPFVKEWSEEEEVKESTHIKFENTKVLLYGIFFGLLTLNLIARLFSASADSFSQGRGFVQVLAMICIATLMVVSEILALRREKAKALKP